MGKKNVYFYLKIFIPSGSLKKMKKEMVLPLKLSYAFHFKKGNLADRTTKKHIKYTSAVFISKNIDLQPPTAPLPYLDDIIHKNS